MLSILWLFGAWVICEYTERLDQNRDYQNLEESVLNIIAHRRRSYKTFSEYILLLYTIFSIVLKWYSLHKEWVIYHNKSFIGFDPDL